MIPYGRQDIAEDDLNAVIEVLQSDFLTQGPAVPAFEHAVREYCGAQHGVAVNSATSALHIACLALDVGLGDLVWTSPITFAASANCAMYCGASVDFVDIDPNTYNMSVAALTAKLEEANKKDALPKVVIPVHLCGQSCDMEAIQNLSEQYGFRIIEDAAHAIGGRYQSEAVGNCRFSDITVFSFHPVKIITTAEGGLATTNDDALAEKMRLYSSHCITRQPEQMHRQPEGPWYYEQIGLGFNYRMTDLQAALGASQMKRLDTFVQKRNEICDKYDKALASLPLKLPMQHADCYSARHLYVIRTQSQDKDRKQIFEALRSNGVGVNVHYIPVYHHPHYRSLGLYEVGVNNCPEAERYYAEAISLPLYPGLTDVDFNAIVDSLSGILSC